MPQYNLQRYNLVLITLCFSLLFGGCSSVSKRDCLNTNWESLGYSDGSRGIHYTQLEKHRQYCAEFKVAPDHEAYRHGWNQGIRNYCTADRGYRLGAAGKEYRNICPANISAGYIAGWERGMRRHCTAENGLRQGLSGKSYNAVCPAGLTSVYHNFYRLGRNVRKARDEHQSIERKVAQTEKQLMMEKSPDMRRKRLLRLAMLQNREAKSDAALIALEACTSGDWFDTGFRDGEDGFRRRVGEIVSVCRNYGIAADRKGYRQGWQRGNQRYCTYKTGLYFGQTNQPYSGVCTGKKHQRFWQGYERGRAIYRADRYEAHPRPVKKRSVKKQDIRLKRLPEKQEETRPVRTPDRDEDED